jgi:hypothetical protein
MAHIGTQGSKVLIDVCTFGPRIVGATVGVELGRESLLETLYYFLEGFWEQPRPPKSALSSQTISRKELSGPV